MAQQSCSVQQLATEAQLNDPQKECVQCDYVTLYLSVC